MASISDTITQQAFDTTTGQKGFDSVSQLVGQIESTALARKKLDHQKQSLAATKDGQNLKDIATYVKIREMNPKLAKSFVSTMARQAEQRGTPLHPDFVTGLEASGMNTTQVSKIVGDYQEGLIEFQRTGVMTEEFAEARGLVADTVYGGNHEALIKLESNEKRSQLVAEGQNLRSESQISARATEATKKRESAGQVALSQKVAAKFADFKTGGGKSGMESSLRLLEEAATALETGEVKTGGISTKIPGFNSDTVQAVVNPKLLEVRTQAQGALNTVLRATLGAAFTEAEGARVLNQVWDDRLSPKVNAKKVRAKIRELRANVKNAEEEFTRFGHDVGKSDSGQPQASPMIKNIQNVIAANPNISDQELVQRLSARMSPAEAAKRVKEARGN